MANKIPLGIALKMIENKNNESGYELLIIHSFYSLCYNSCLSTHYHIEFLMGTCSCCRVIMLQVPGLCSWSSELS